MTSQNEKTTAALLHLSAFAKYLIPFAGIVVPLIIWQTKKHQSEYVDENGKAVVNFHLSILAYSIVIAIVLGIFFIGSIANYIEIENAGGDVIPIDLITVGIIAASVLGIWTIAEFILVILGTVRANEGSVYKYPFTINFIK
ncbi:MAG TPA: DUF4870 domain-containing protein [Flavobacterium sp.]|uniref:DUF4870 domain-containing protein n=1 Tax=unclassified Flavobacterium TaxID=196869 RepID=UPI000E864F14|nr:MULTISPECIES: DUF4870 domain-containing protein [unclassified Flavobacterium]HBI01925.1 DUF4870 domain-containing protein [Flavobacterium sp.]HRE79250.1 DUF4870 domain-containing protein [Flavobacterium sp.]